MEDYPFFASIATAMPCHPSKQVMDVASDGTGIYYNTDYLETASTEEVYCLMAKAVMHRVLMHPFRRGNRDKKIWNAACTASVLPILEQNNLSYGLPRLVRWNPMVMAAQEQGAKVAEQAYLYLKDLMDEQPQEGEGEGDEGEGESQGQSQSQGQGQSQAGDGDSSDDSGGGSSEDQDTSATPDPQKGEQKNESLEKTPEELQPQGDAPQQPPPEPKPDISGEVLDGPPSDAPQQQSSQPQPQPRSQEEIQREVTQQVIAAYSLAEKNLKAGSSGLSALREIVVSTSTIGVDWQGIIDQYLQDTLVNEEPSFSRRNRRMMGSEIIYPGKDSEPDGTLVFSIDTSGSLDSWELGFIRDNIKHIIEVVNPLKSVVIYCDTAVRHVVEFERDDEINLSMHGGGGTRFEPPFNYLVEHPEIEPDLMIYFTDGGGTCRLCYDDVPYYPVLWATTSRKPHFGACGEFGEIIHIEYDPTQYRREQAA
jgi:predicted metal-dependent peptidase